MRITQSYPSESFRTVTIGTGGALSEEGVAAAAEAINAKRSLLRQVSVILESGESELLADFVKLLYRRATEISQPQNGNGR